MLIKTLLGTISIDYQLLLSVCLFKNCSFMKILERIREGFQKKKCKALDIVQIGGRGAKRSNEMPKPSLNVEQRKIWPQTAEFIDK